MDQDQPVEPPGEGQPSEIVSMVNLGLRLTQACRYVYLHQGISITDLVWVLHGVLGQVLSWAYKRP